MCLAVPGKIIEINDDVAIVDYELEKREGKIMSGEYAVGDYVIIQAGFILSKVNEQEAKESLAMYKSL